MATRYLLIDGARRCDAAKRAGIQKIMAVVFKNLPSELELLKARAGIDFHHRPLAWGERIDLTEQLQLKTGCTVNQLAAMLNISQSLASKLYKGREVAPQVRQALDAGLIDIEKLSIIAGEADHAKQLELLQGADGMTRNMLRQKAHADANPGNVKTSIARFPLPKGGVTVTVQGPKMNLLDAIRVLLAVLKELKRGQAEQLDITTVMLAMRDRCKASS